MRADRKRLTAGGMHQPKQLQVKNIQEAQAVQLGHQMVVEAGRSSNCQQARVWAAGVGEDGREKAKVTTRSQMDSQS